MACLLPIGLPALAAAYYGRALLGSDARALLPGETTQGHYQIELACSACHEPFGGVKEKACLDCHGQALQDAQDAHPRSKFDDPRNADRLSLIDARRCVTCHQEHRPAETRGAGVTQPKDYCLHCHSSVGDERPSHRGMAFDSCATAGCHNYHDNRALNLRFLEKHARDVDTRPGAALPQRAVAAAVGTPPPHDGPLGSAEALVRDWASTAHARGGVNCGACHGAGAAWKDRPPAAACAGCHEGAAEGFSRGRHGMRGAAGLPPMDPAEARLPMRREAAGVELSCVACHGAHRFDTARAAAAACAGCHADAHSLAYAASPHAELWRKELAGTGVPGSGVSCATCHLPRTEAGAVVHNQNDNLRPSSKMALDVCLRCHGLPYSLAALADADLVKRNFASRPAARLRTFDLVDRFLESSRRASPAGVREE